MTQKKEKPKLEDGTNQKWIDFLSKGGKITEVGIWKDECYFSKKHDIFKTKICVEENKRYIWKHHGLMLMNNSQFRNFCEENKDKVRDGERKAACRTIPMMLESLCDDWNKVKYDMLDIDNAIKLSEILGFEEADTFKTNFPLIIRCEDDFFVVVETFSGYW